MDLLTPEETRRSHKRSQKERRLALKRVAIKRELRKAGIPYPQKIVYNLGQLRKLKNQHIK